MADLPRGESQSYYRGLGRRMRKHRDTEPPAERLRESQDRFDPKEAEGDSGGMRRDRKRFGNSVTLALGDTGFQPWQQGSSQGAHADSGLRRNRSTKTRKGRERNL